MKGAGAWGLAPTEIFWRTGESVRRAYLQDTVTSILVAGTVEFRGSKSPIVAIMRCFNVSLPSKSFKLSPTSSASGPLARWMLLAAKREQLWVKAYLRICFHSQRGGAESREERQAGGSRLHSPPPSPEGGRDPHQSLQLSVVQLMLLTKGSYCRVSSLVNNLTNA